LNCLQFQTRTTMQMGKGTGNVIDQVQLWNAVEIV